MRAYMECGVCGDHQDVRGVDAGDALAAITYAFWVRHDAHPDWMFRVSQYSRGGAYDGTAVRTGADEDEGEE